VSSPELNATAIRLDAVARLVGKTVAGDNVHDTRNVAFVPAVLPALSVSTITSSNTRLNQGSSMARHVESVVVSADLAGDDEATLAAAMDTIEGEILDALMGDDEWLYAFEEVNGPDTRKDISVEGARLIGTVHMKFDLQYTIHFTRTAPEVSALEKVYMTVTPTDPVGANVSRRALLGDREEEGA
jgi:hypothetical protein